ncbi:unnamed protein product [Pleuronectes platessa]|uniref:Uncharacterized protein n=1 Tax=Pleuronectes platessa TaxID=8262 RepID=A0A9N7Z1P9_PLEPL|nr:unnamed protein product [Pleuronectes platessa]
MLPTALLGCKAAVVWGSPPPPYASHIDPPPLHLPMEPEREVVVVGCRGGPGREGRVGGRGGGGVAHAEQASRGVKRFPAYGRVILGGRGP